MVETRIEVRKEMFQEEAILQIFVRISSYMLIVLSGVSRLNTNTPPE